MPRNVYPMNTRRDLIFPDIRGTMLDQEEPYTEDVFQRFSQSTTTTWIVDRMIMAVINREHQASIERIRRSRERTRARIARERTLQRQMRTGEWADELASAERHLISIGQSPAAVAIELARARAEYEAEQQSLADEEASNEISSEGTSVACLSDETSEG